MSGIKRRHRVRVDKFKAQLAEEVIGEDSLVELEIGKGEVVTIYIPIDPDETQEVMEGLRAVGDDLREGALVVFAKNPIMSAEEQLEKWEDAGFDVPDLLRIYGAESSRVREALGKFRYRS